MINLSDYNLNNNFFTLRPKCKKHHLIPFLRPLVQSTSKKPNLNLSLDSHLCLSLVSETPG